MQITLSLLGVVMLLTGTLAHKAGGNEVLPMKTAVFSPHRSLIVLTRESWGCFSGQSIIQDVTSFLDARSKEPVRILPLKAVEDRADRVELVLLFDAQPLLSRPGFLIFKLSPEQREGDERSDFSLTKASLVIGEVQGQAHLELEGRLQGGLNAELLFSREDHLKKGRFVCPEEDLFDPTDVQFFPWYPLPPLATVETRGNPIDKPGGLRITLQDSWVRAASAVAACTDVLAVLEREFSHSGDLAFWWERRKITAQELDNLAGSMEQGKHYKFFITCRLLGRRGAEEITRPGDRSKPLVRQRVTLSESSGETVGGEVWIGLNRQ